MLCLGREGEVGEWIAGGSSGIGRELACLLAVSAERINVWSRSVHDLEPGGVVRHAQMLASGRWKEAVQGYLAAIAYLDMNLGRLFEAPERSPDRDRTIVCVWSDHGWHLAEKSHWRTFTRWEQAPRRVALGEPVRGHLEGLARPITGGQGGRAQTAAHLADHVIPPVPVRQWVISVPKRLRGMLADGP